MKKPYLEAGKVVGTHGVRGEFKIQPWCDSAAFLCGFGGAAPRRELLLSIQSGGSPEYLALAAWRLVGESENRK